MFRWCYADPELPPLTRGPSARQTSSMPNAAGAAQAAPDGGYRRAVTNQQATKQAGASDEFYPGRRYGLPEFGPGSVAGWSRRLGALLIDWFACSVIAIAFLYHPAAGHHLSDALVQPRLWTPVIFGIEDCVLTALTGFTIGKRLLGLRVVRLDGRPVGLPRALARTVLLLLAVPALMMDRDLRGLQDKAAGTTVVRI